MTRYVEDIYEDDDLPPCIGGRIVDSLHRRFEEHFGTPLEPQGPAPAKEENP